MSRWSRGSRSSLTPAPGMILPGVPMASPGSVDALEAPPSGDPLAGPAPSLIDRVDLPVHLAMPDGIDPLDAELEAELAGATPGSHRVREESSPVEAADAMTDIDAEIVDVEVVEDVVVAAPPPAGVTRVPVSQPAPAAPDASAGEAENTRLASNVISGPWPDPEGPGWPREIPAWGAAPAGYGRALTTAVLVFKDGTTVAAAPEEADRLRAVAEQLGA